VNQRVNQNQSDESKQVFASQYDKKSDYY